jgi:predicted chitinase
MWSMVTGFQPSLWIRLVFGRARRRAAAQGPKRAPRCRPRAEILEDRTVPSGWFDGLGFHSGELGLLAGAGPDREGGFFPSGDPIGPSPDNTARERDQYGALLGYDQANFGFCPDASCLRFSATTYTYGNAIVEPFDATVGLGTVSDETSRQFGTPAVLTVLPDSPPGTPADVSLSFEVTMATSVGISPVVGSLPLDYGASYVYQGQTHALFSGSEDALTHVVQADGSDPDLSKTFDTSVSGKFRAYAGETFSLVFFLRGSGSFRDTGGGSGVHGIYVQVNLTPQVTATPLAAPRLEATSLTWDTEGDGVDFSYRVSHAPLSHSTNVALYWSSGDQFADRIGGPIPGTSQTVAVGTVVGDYGPFHVTADALGSSPLGATHLLMVTDPENVLNAFDPSVNVRTLDLSGNVVPTALRFNLDGSLDFNYNVAMHLSRQGVRVAVFWAKGDRIEDVLNTGSPLFSLAVPGQSGSYGPVHVDLNDILVAPPEATRLVVVGDPDDLLHDPNRNEEILALRANLSPLTAAQLVQLMPELSQASAEQFVGPLNAAIAQYNVHTFEQRAMFLAQLGTESLGLTRWAERYNGNRYKYFERKYGYRTRAGKNLGNKRRGDGALYAGRGPIQITGRYNVTQAARVFNVQFKVNLVKDPSPLSDMAHPQLGMLSAAWYWEALNQHNLNEVTDRAAGTEPFDFTERVTRVVNGGLNGLADRFLRYMRIRSVLFQ